MNKKKLFTSAICALLVVIAIVSLCACNGNGVSSFTWKRLGLTSSTLTLPQLKISQTKSVNSKEAVAMSIAWDDGTEEDFNALATECFTKIPANRDENGNTISSIDKLITADDEVMTFISAYQISGSTYFCSVIYFIEDYNGKDFIDDSKDVTYKSKQLLLVLQKQIVQVGEKHSWDIDSDDKTWFTQEELALLGLEGLQAPEGKILGKLASDEFGDQIFMQMSIEIASSEVYYSFIQKLFSEYNMNMSSNGVVVDSYDNRLIFYASEHYTSFSPCYNVGDKVFRADINLDDGHIVIMLGER